MRDLAAEVRSIGERLDLPEPVRSRIVMELASDLWDLADALSAEGMAEPEARRRAVEMLLPSPEALAELERLHRPLYQRLVDRFSSRARHGLERVLLAVLGLVVLGAGVRILGDAALLRDPSPYLWPVLGLGVFVLSLGMTKLSQLYVKKDHGRRSLERGMWALPVAVGATLATAFTGAVADLYVAASTISAAPAREAAVLLRWLRQDMALLGVALLVVSLAALLWLVASVRIARIEQAEAVALGYLNTLEERNES